MQGVKCRVQGVGCGVWSMVYGVWSIGCLKLVDCLCEWSRGCRSGQLAVQPSKSQKITGCVKVVKWLVTGKIGEPAAGAQHTGQTVLLAV